MKVSMRIGRASAMIALALPAAAMAQYTGVSHPDETPIVNTLDTNPQPVYQPARPVATIQAMTATQPLSKPSPQIPMDAAPVASLGSHPTLTAENISTSNADAGIVTRLPGPSNQLPAGTMMKVRIAENISTERTPSGTKFTAELVQGVERDGRILLPAGSILSGYVTDIHGGKRMSGGASIHLKTSTVTLPDGMKYMVNAQVIDTGLFKELKIDQEGTIYSRDHAGKTASTMALTTGSGIAAGAMIGGVPGALIGAGVGAGVSTIVWMKQDRQADLPSETVITFSLNEPVTIAQ